MLQADHGDTTGGLDETGAKELRARLEVLDDRIADLGDAMATLWELLQCRTVDEGLPFRPVSYLADRLEEHVAGAATASAACWAVVGGSR